MAHFRVETVFDPEAARFYAELYYPDDSAEPYARTRPIFPSHEAAADFAIESFKKVFEPDHPVSVTGSIPSS